MHSPTSLGKSIINGLAAIAIGLIGVSAFASLAIQLFVGWILAFVFGVLFMVPLWFIFEPLSVRFSGETNETETAREPWRIVFSLTVIACLIWLPRTMLWITWGCTCAVTFVFSGETKDQVRD